MKSFIITWTLILFCITGFTPSAHAADYQLGADDVLSISVWGHDDLKDPNLIVRPDGKISFPLAGELEVTGLTPAKLTEKLTAVLSTYVIDPRVTVNIVKFRTIRVYVLGEVPKPGMFELTKEHTLLDAIGMSGYTAYAAKKKVSVIRRGDKVSSLTINLQSIMEKGDFSQNVTLNEGDVVYLSNNGKIEFFKDIAPWISQIYMINRWNK